MSKTKISNEFAIKLVHPIYGEYYYSYNGWNSGRNTFVFTKNINKVTKWRTSRFVEKEINHIIKYLNDDKGRVFLSLGSVINDDLKIKENVIYSRKKYYYSIADVKSFFGITTSMSSIDDINKSLMTDYKKMIELSADFVNLLNIDHEEFIKYDNFWDYNSTVSSNEDEKLVSNFYKFANSTFEISKNANSYMKNRRQIGKLSNDDIYLDIVDASYGFRKLKLKTLELNKE